MKICNRNFWLAILSAFFIIQCVVAEPSVQVTTFSSQERLKFIPNQGQWDDKALYQSRSGKHTTWFASDGAYHQFIKQKDSSFASSVFQLSAVSCSSGLSEVNSPKMASPAEPRNTNLHTDKTIKGGGLQELKRQRPSREYS